MRTRKMTDRMLLESLVNKYGAKRLTNVINEMNENQDDTVQMSLRKYLKWYLGGKSINDMYRSFMGTDFDIDSLKNNFGGDYDAQWDYLVKHMNDMINIEEYKYYGNYMQEFMVGDILFAVESIDSIDTI